jgi:hypothetical protein
MHEKTLLYSALGTTALAAVFAVYRVKTAPRETLLITPVTMVDSSGKLADSSSPIRLTASDGSGIALVAMTANAVVEDPLALTELHLVFENPEDRVREGTFRITLPQGASLSRFAMKVENVWQEGEVVEKQAARRAYEDALHRRQDPALLEQGGGNEFSARVFPIPPRGRKELILTYAEVLAANAPYTLPLKGLPTLGTLDVDVQASGDRSASFGIHKQRFAPGEDFTVASKELPRSTGVRSNELVVARVVPFAASRPDPVASAVVLVDTSASRALGLRDQAELLRGILGKLEETSVTVAAFDQEIEPLYQGRAAGFGGTGFTKLVERGALGASNLGQAIDWAAEEAKKTKAKRVVLVTDGVTTLGETDPQKLRAKVEALRAAGVERIDAIAVGGIRDDGLLRTVVRGVLDKDGVVLDAKLGDVVIARRLGEATSSGVPVAVAGATWSWPKTLDGLQAGDETLVYAKMDAASAPVKIKIGEQEIAIAVRAVGRPIVERALAQAEIQSLVEAPTKDAATTKRDIIALSTRHRVLSPHTALLVLETDADYARCAIDRNAKVDILSVKNGRVAIMQSGRAQPPPPPPPKPVEMEAHRPRPGNGTLGAAPPSPEMLGAPHGGAAAPGALGRSDIPPVALEAPAADVAATAAAPPAAAAATPWTDNGELRVGGGGGAVQGGSGGGGLAGLGAGSGRGSGSGSAQEQRVEGPRGDVQISGAIVTGGTVADADRVVAGLRARFRHCYQRGLASDPRMSGRVVLDAKLERNGEVASATVQSNSGLSPTTAECLASVLKRSQFSAPNAEVHIKVPVTFVISERTTGPSTPTGSPDTPSTPIARPFEAPPKPPESKPYDGPTKLVMELLARGDKDSALKEARAWQAKASGDVMALVGLGEALEAKGDAHGAARAYGSILELFASRADSRRFAGERLERINQPFALELAADTYGKAAGQRPDHPASHRLYAFTLLKAGQYEKAFHAIVNGSKRGYPAGRFAGVDRILHEDVGLIAAAWTKAEPARGKEIAALREEAHGADESNPSVRFVLVWETDANDVDFHIYDGKGGHAYYGNRALPSGGSLYADVTTGYGPECFTIRGARADRAYPYTLQAHYYSRGPMGYGMGKLQIIEHDGKGTLIFEERPFVVMVDRAFVDLGVVDRPKK